MAYVEMGAYPAIPPATAPNPDPPRGSLQVKYEKATDTLHIEGLLTNLAIKEAGGWHVHTVRAAPSYSLDCRRSQ